MNLRTTDLYEAAFLRAKGHKLTCEHGKRCVFKFDETAQVDRDEFINGAMVNVSHFISAIQTLKNLIYQFKR